MVTFVVFRSDVLIVALGVYAVEALVVRRISFAIRHVASARLVVRASKTELSRLQS